MNPKGFTQLLLLLSCMFLFIASQCEGENAPEEKKPTYTTTTYEVGGETTTEAREQIFDKEDGKGPKDKKGERHAGLTTIDYRFGLNGPQKPEKVDGKCSCTVTVDTIMAQSTITVKLPTWSGYKAASKDCQAKWDEFIQNLKKHEETHADKYEKGFQKALDTLRKKWKGKTATKVADTCKKACEAAFDALFAELDKALKTELAPVEKDQEAYDAKTNHGETEGAVLKDCNPN